MKVLFLGQQYDRTKEVEYLKLSRQGLSASGNEYQWNICDGLLEHLRNDLEIISVLPVGTYPRRFRQLKLQNHFWIYRGIKVDELGSLNLPFIKQFQRENSCYKKIKNWSNRFSGEQRLIILYSLYLPYLKAVCRALIADPSLRAIIIVTDLPGKYGVLPDSKVKAALFSATGKIALSYSKYFHGYILLTKEMCIPLDTGNKPYTIIDGITKNYGYEIDSCSACSMVPYILYTGALNKIYGVCNLLDAFELIDNSEAELWICGAGGAADEIQARAENNPKIKFLGFQPKEKILQLQANATVLVNPRTSQGEYTKYSFPSKTIEYMASGTPTVMHRLPGVSKEYEEYIVFARDDSCQSLAEAIQTVLSWPPAQRKAFGKRGQIFVKENKNPYIQAKKLLDMAEQLF